MSKQFIGIIVAIILVFAGIVLFTGDKAASPSAKSSKGKPTQHVMGQGETGISLIEYGDYQCPYCEQYYPTVKAVQAKFDKEIKFQFRNFPLPSLHPNAYAAARAAEAADLQGKFWEMHDALYESQNWQVWTNAKNPNPNFEQYAKTLGLDVAKFKTDFASSEVNNRVSGDLAAGNKLGITGTPSFYIDGKKVEIGNTVEEFTKVIQAAIDNKNAN